MSTWRTPRCEIASTIALCTAGVEPSVADSPMPLAPSGLCGLGVSVLNTSYDGSSAADGRATVVVDGATVGDVFTTLVDRHPGLRANLLDDAGGLHKFVNVYKDDDDIRYLDGLDTKLADGDVLTILPAVAGGA